MLTKQVRIKNYEVGLYFRDGEFQRLLTKGRHWLPGWILGPLWNIYVDVVSQRDPWIEHDKLDVIVKSGALTDLAKIVDLKDSERALVWIEGRFSHILPPGLYAYWTGFKDVRIEVVDAREVRLQHGDLKTIVRSPYAAQTLDICSIEQNHVGVSFQDGDYVETLAPGQYAFWKNVADSKVVEFDMREQALDVAGQEIMTADKVILRMNALVTYRTTAARKAVMRSQANTAKLLADNPTLMRLRELEVLERVATAGNLNVVLGGKGLADRVVNLL